MDAWTFVNKEARFVKKPLKIVLLVLAAVLLVVISYLAYVLIDYHRLGDMDLEVDRQVSQPAQTGCEYHLLSYNIGFGAYEPDYGFFMDGGTESWAWSQERLTANVGNIGAFLAQQDADLYLIQEVDRNSTRSYMWTRPPCCDPCCRSMTRPGPRTMIPPS